VTDQRTRLPVDLDRLPPVTFEAAITYLRDVLRECQLVLVAVGQGRRTDPVLESLAAGLVPDIEEMADAFRAAQVASNPDGSVRLVGSLQLHQAGTIAHLQMQMVQLRLLGRRGGLLVESDPQISQLLAWMWEELADQLHGRAPRPYRPAT